MPQTKACNISTECTRALLNCLTILAAFGLSSKMIIRDVVVKKTIFKPEHQKTFRAIPERVCEVFLKKKIKKN